MKLNEAEHGPNSSVLLSQGSPLPYSPAFMLRHQIDVPGSTKDEQKASIFFTRLRVPGRWEGFRV